MEQWGYRELIDTDWITLEQDGGELRVTTAASPSLEVRESTITVTGGPVPEVDRDFVVIQAPTPPIITLEPVALTFQYMVETNNMVETKNAAVTLSSADGWSVGTPSYTDGDGWITATKSNNNTLTVTVTANASTSARAGSVQVVPAQGGTSGKAVTLSITQLKNPYNPAFIQAIREQDVADATGFIVAAPGIVDVRIPAGEPDVGLTPLMLAARYNSGTDIVRLLVSRGADASRTVGQGWTALMYAVAYNANVEVTKEVLEADDPAINAKIRVEIPSTHPLIRTQLLRTNRISLSNGRSKSSVPRGASALILATFLGGGNRGRAIGKNTRFGGG